MNKTEAQALVEQNREFLAGLSDDIWDHPETDYTEHYAAGLLKGVLEQEGFSVKSGLAGIPTAFSGSWGAGKPVIGLLGEFDALPGLSQAPCVAEKKALVEGGNGHGCGHNLLGVGSLGAAIAVKAYLAANKLPGTVIYFGCPAEEGGSAKAFLARDGVFEGVDACLSWHPSSLNSVWSFSSLANVRVKYSFKGTAAHAGTAPHLGRSALDALELMNVGVQFLREHVVPEARMHYAITNTGGTAPNVVQAEAESVYLLRAPKNDQVLDILERVNQIAKGAAMMCGVEVECRLEKGASNVLVNVALSQLLHDNMKAVDLPAYTEEETAFARAIQQTLPGRTRMADRLLQSMGEKGRVLGQKLDDLGINRMLMPLNTNAKPISGSTDVGDVSWVCPTCQLLAVTNAGGTPEHSWQMVSQNRSSIAHKGMIYAAQVLTGAVIDLLEQPAILEEATAEFHSRRGPKGYQPLLGADLKPAIPE